MNLKKYINQKCFVKGLSVSPQSGSTIGAADSKPASDLFVRWVFTFASTTQPAY